MFTFIIPVKQDVPQLIGVMNYSKILV